MSRASPHPRPTPKTFGAALPMSHQPDRKRAVKLLPNRGLATKNTDVCRDPDLDRTAHWRAK
jgi:hypothetical protein